MTPPTTASSFNSSPTLRQLAFALALLSPVAASAQTAQTAAPPEPLQTIARLDVGRYLGTWYEIAKYPNRFQRQCVADTSALYRLRDDGQLDVINRCRQANGQVVEAVGRARQDGPADSPKLKVRFAPAWLSWLPMVWGNYWVIDLDPGYQLVAVSEPSREYLWVLSRTPTVEAGAYQALLNRLREKGFDLTRLERTAHAGKPD
ncbi:lipocalin family protein [Hydrogenophaga sp.]|uniref:lipocalin family protein n=1 Tax=Hydrogenophaga sp. TaxID=1904254 RepID=UPI00272414F3|nr:lipocalin family protein [Hydrogenophaga sp.]MDO9251895.1 lipocalin family protein [Hydrogenophaga sp.]MDP2407646.1 lipocalin family protein [Hydrogenophaga sp.]MDP3342897.1 lipocalin family protein [Hydrogenophaga sp.]MDP3885178.1 lipocalin family protein [Hydrogenophaga sp.]MDZ4173917.1 lipocalin family protein [Hydrogenophaga sp.]